MTLEVQLRKLIYVHFPAASMLVEWKLYRRRQPNISHNKYTEYTITLNFANTHQNVDMVHENVF